MGLLMPSPQGSADFIPAGVEEPFLLTPERTLQSGLLGSNRTHAVAVWALLLLLVNRSFEFSLEIEAGESSARYSPRHTLTSTIHHLNHPVRRVVWIYLQTSLDVGRAI